MHALHCAVDGHTHTMNNCPFDADMYEDTCPVFWTPTYVNASAAALRAIEAEIAASN